MRIWARRDAAGSCARAPPAPISWPIPQPPHSFRVYAKHASWLNQIELWFSILVRRLLKRASFSSVEQLKERVLSFIEYFNRTMAKPFKWTYTGKALVA